MRERAWVLVAVLFAAAIVLGARALGAGIRARGTNRNDSIAVTGSAKRLIDSDYVIWGRIGLEPAGDPRGGGEGAPRVGGGRHEVPRERGRAALRAERRAGHGGDGAQGSLRLRNVDVGVFQVTPPNSTDISAHGVYDTSTFQKDLTAVVNVSFALS